MSKDNWRLPSHPAWCVVAEVHSREECKRAECGAVYVTNTLGGMDICVRPQGHTGGHDWRKS